MRRPVCPDSVTVAPSETEAAEPAKVLGAGTAEALEVLLAALLPATALLLLLVLLPLLLLLLLEVEVLESLADLLPKMLLKGPLAISFFALLLVAALEAAPAAAFEAAPAAALEAAPAAVPVALVAMAVVGVVAISDASLAAAR